MIRPRAERDSRLTAEQWGRLEELLSAALAVPADARGDFLERACDGDAALRVQLGALLAAHERPGILDQPLVRWTRTSDRSGTHLIEGAMVGHYEIRELLGRGGMGEVYRARDVQLERSVALKFLPATRSMDASAKARFLIEARAAAALEHVNVCGVHEIGETADGHVFIVMAYVDGESLRERMDRGTLTAAEAVNIARQIASALRCAHEHDVIHRDVKPANVMLGTDGTVKLVDFGVAKLEGSTLTGAGATPGTTAYMSPEQVRGEEVDHRTDLWALGVVLYEMLAGKRPFVGSPEAATLHAIVTTTPTRLRALNPEVSPALEEIVERALTKKRERRHATAAELEHALQQVGEAGGGGPSRRRWFSRRRVIALSTAAIVLVGAAMAWFGKTGRAGTLIGDDVLARNDLVLVSDFQNRTADSSLAETITDAIRVELQQSRAVRVMSQAAMWEGLDRMGLDHGVSLPQPQMQELAEREGVKAFVIGDIARLGSGYQVTARVVATSGGSEVLTARATASSDAELIGAVERVGRTLRRGIGESLRSVLATPPLAQVTTASLPALRIYTSASRAEGEGQRLRAVALAKEALVIDTSFASAWDLLNVAYANGGSVRLAAEASRRAYALRDRLPEDERLRVTARYHAIRGERTEEEAAWLTLAARGGRDEVNYTAMLMDVGRLTDAEVVARRAVVSNPSSSSAYWNLTELQVARQDFAAAESTLARMSQHMPESAYRYWLTVSIPYGRRDFDAVEAYVRSAEGARVPTRESYQCLADVQRGRVSAWRRCPEPEVWVRRSLLALAQFRLTGDSSWARAGYAPFLAALRDARELEEYPGTIALLAEVGRLRDARSLLEEWRERAGRDDPGYRADSAQAVGAIAAAGGDLEGAVAAFLAWHTSPGTSAYHYYNRGLPEAAALLRQRGAPDSSIVLLERALSMPSISGGGVYEAGWYAQALEMLGELHEARGDRTIAAGYYRRYVELLSGADAPIAEHVNEVRRKLEGVTSEPRRSQ